VRHHFALHINREQRDRKERGATLINGLNSSLILEMMTTTIMTTTTTFIPFFLSRFNARYFREIQFSLTGFLHSKIKSK
jgi:preprotein translocase subunit SecF